MGTREGEANGMQRNREGGRKGRGRWVSFRHGGHVVILKFNGGCVRRVLSGPTFRAVNLNSAESTPRFYESTRFSPGHRRENVFYTHTHISISIYIYI